jgi:hypothetical protein
MGTDRLSIRRCARGTRLLLVAALAVSGSMVPARADVIDWVTLKVTAGSTGGDVRMGIDGRARLTGGEAAYTGIGDGSDAGGFILVSNAGADPLRVQTTKGAGGLSIEVLPAVGGGELQFHIVMLGAVHLDPGETLEHIFFIANGEIIEQTTHVDLAPVGATQLTTTGNGSRALPIADPQNAGIAVAVGEIVVGTATHSEQTTSGIAGGVATQCTICVGDWHSPDGRSGTWNGEPGAAFGDLTFAGPAGDWAWTWTGESHSQSPAILAGEPMFGAYAPIGDDWVFFKSF